MADDKRPKEDKKEEKKKQKQRNRYANAANSVAIQEALDEQDDHDLISNIDPNPRPGTRNPEQVSRSAAANLQTRSDTPPDMIRGPEGQLYPKNMWRFMKADYRHEQLNNPLPDIPDRVRPPSPVESSTPEEQEPWSDEDPAFCGYGQLEEDDEP